MSLEVYELHITFDNVHMYNSYTIYFKKLPYFKLLNCLSCLPGVYVNMFSL